MLRVFLNCFQLLQISFCCSKNGPFSFYRNPIFINWKNAVCFSFLGALKIIFQRESLALFVFGRVCHHWPSRWGQSELDSHMTSSPLPMPSFPVCVSDNLLFSFLEYFTIICFVLKLMYYAYILFNVASLSCEPLNNSWNVSFRSIMK